MPQIALLRVQGAGRPLSANCKTQDRMVKVSLCFNKGYCMPMVGKDMIRHADEALYAAKASGRKRIVLHRSPSQPSALFETNRKPAIYRKRHDGANIFQA
jgi:hypothetical protein